MNANTFCTACCKLVNSDEIAQCHSNLKKGQQCQAYNISLATSNPDDLLQQAISLTPNYKQKKNE